MSIADIDVPFSLVLSVGVSINVVSNLGVLAAITWQVLFVSLPMVYLAFQLQVIFIHHICNHIFLPKTSKLEHLSLRNI